MKKTLFLLLLSLFIVNCTNDSESDLQEEPTTETDNSNDDSNDDNADDGNNDDNTDNGDGTNGGNDDGSDDNGSGDDNTSKLSYATDIAPIISANCINCHGSPTRSGAPTSYNTYQLVKSGASRMDSRMNNASNPMPRSGLISQASRDKFKQWISDGMLE